MQKFPITAEQIDQVVTVFYARIRKHPALGLIFLGAVGTSDEVWRSHEAKIAAFWRNAMQIDRGYSGNPMRVHMANPDIQPQHFSVWLGLFHQTLQDTLPPDTARSFGALADRIGQSLRFGLENYRQPASDPPIL